MFVRQNWSRVANRSVVMGLALLIVAGAATAPVLAEGSGASKTSAPADSTGVKKSLQGGVKLIEVDLGELRDMDLDIKRVRNAANSLKSEVSRQAVTINTTPSMIGMGTIIQVPTSFSGGGYLPPRKTAIDAAMGAMRPFIELSKRDVDDFAAGNRQLDLSESTRAKMKPLSEEWVRCISGSYSQLKILDDLTRGPSYDDQSIAGASSVIDKNMKDLGKALKQFYKLLQKEGKQDKEKGKDV